jgi:hypothetical protein
MWDKEYPRGSNLKVTVLYYFAEGNEYADV